MLPQNFITMVLQVKSHTIQAGKIAVDAAHDPHSLLWREIPY